jgi:hypothetical protein
MSIHALKLCLLVTATSTNAAFAATPCEQSLLDLVPGATLEDIVAIPGSEAIEIARNLIEGGGVIVDAIQNRNAAAYRYGHTLLVGVNQENSCVVLAVEWTD